MEKKKFRAVRSFHDSEAGKRVRAGDSLTLDGPRAADLLRNGLVEAAPVKAEAKPSSETTTGSKAKADTKGTADAGQPAAGK